MAQLTAIGHTNQHQQHTTIGSTDQHDSNKFIPSSSPVNSSSFKSVHDIAPVMESYGLRQRRGRETQWHAQNENIDDGFQESCHINDGSWRQNTYHDGFQESCPTNDGLWRQNTYDGFQESCHTNDGSWRQNTYNLDEQNDSDEEEDDGDDDDDDDGGKAHRKLHMNAHNERGKHAKNPNDDDDDDDDDNDNANANDNEHGDDDERNQKSPSSSSIQREDVSSSSSSSKPHSRKEEKKEKKKKLWHDYMCCRCASRFTVDCAAVCCCPLALVHLAALTFIRLPASLLWRMLVNLKSRMCVKRPPPTEDMEFDEGSSVRRRTNGNFHNGKEDEALEPSSHRIIRFESQKLWQHFGTGDLDFGGFTMRGD